jgi:glucan 1,6-alpha-glucosidase
MVTVGETWGVDIEKAKLFSNPDGSELSMVFQFNHIMLDQKPGGEKWDLMTLPFKDLKKVLSDWQTGLYGKGWNSLFWDNHDLPRIVSRWGDDGHYRVESAKMLAGLLHGMQGTPYIYEGEELGMTNVRYELDDYKDIETLSMYRERIEKGYKPEDIMQSIYAKSRDNARTPMQWNADANAGFTTGTPWIRVNPNYTQINAADQVDDPDSVFSFYKKLISLRKKLPVLLDGRFELKYEDSEDLFVYTRTDAGQKFLVVCNFHGNEIPYPDRSDWEGMECIISNYSDGEYSDTLRPYELRWYIK